MNFKPKQKKGFYTIPKWTKVAETYNKAVEIALKELAKERSFYNYREGRLGQEYLKESEDKKKKTEILYKQKGDYISFKAQLGEKYKGKSVESVRTVLSENEFGLGAYEVACILISHPNILTKYEDLWLDCPGDEYSWVADGEFGNAPYFSFRGGEVGISTRDVSFPDDHYGSASGIINGSNDILTQSQISNPRILERLENLEQKMDKIQKFLILD